MTNVFIVLSVVKKNYTRLCECLPQDHMKNIDNLKKLLKLPDNWFSTQLASLSTFGFANEGIIVTLMVKLLDTDEAALQVCDIMEKLIDSEPSKRVVDTFRNGNCLLQ